MVGAMTTQRKTAPALETVEVLLDEVDECYNRFSKIRRELSRVRRGSGPFLDLMAHLEVELFTLKQKTEHAHEALEEFQESLPDE
jgi:hypothetical protein